MKPRLLISITLATLFGLVLAVPYIQRTRNEVVCLGNLKAIAVHLHEYHEKYHHFPPAFVADVNGKPMHSWRALLLEFIDHELFREYDFSKPWDHPANLKLESKMPACFACPNAAQNAGKWRTNYVVIRGEGTAFPGKKFTSFSQVKDDKGSCILLVEMAPSNIHWLEPRDLDIQSMSFKINDSSKDSISCQGCRGPGVCFIDGITGRLKADIPPSTLRSLIAIHGGEKVNLSKVLLK